LVLQYNGKFPESASARRRAELATSTHHDVQWPLRLVRFTDGGFAVNPAETAPVRGRKKGRMAKRRKSAATSAAPKHTAERSGKRATARPKAARVRTTPPSRRTPLERAQEMAWKAFETSDVERRLELARKALELSSDCADAYTILSRIVSDPRQALILLEQGLAAAERAMGPEVMAQSVGVFWALHETRPYMRARQALAECLWTMGSGDEAVAHLQEMLRLNPPDNQGIRYLLAAHLLELDRNADFDRLVEMYDEPGAFLAFSRVLREFRRSGDSTALRKLLAKARAVNRRILPLLLHGPPPPQELPDSFSPGQADEALLYVADFAGGWKQTPGAITWLRQAAHSGAGRPRKAPVGPTDAAKRQLARLPQSYGTIWQVAVSRVATWMRDGAQMVRPWSILIVNHTEHLIIGQELVTPEPTAELVFDQLARAMRHPLAGKRHRPSEIQVRDEPLWNAVQPHVEEIGVDCIFRTELEEADYILGEMHKLMRPEGQPPGISEPATFTSAQGASFYEAAAAYFRRTPWRKLPSTAMIQIDCPQMREFGPGRWYAVVLGQAGQTLGLAVYNDRRAVEEVCGACCSGRGPGDATALSILFGEGFEVPIADWLAAEQHHWPLAGPEAYPLALCSTGGGVNVRPLETWELQLLEACVRTIPDFVEQNPYVKGPAGATLGPVAPANLKLTLSWVEPEEGCGDECGHCAD
jgi:tetratricopeptide (TPR) repeat protein